MKRRDFLKGMGGALGGAILLSCGSGGSGSDSGGLPVPSGYKFYKLYNTGDTLPDGSAAGDFPGQVMINDHSEIIFHARDDSDDAVERVYELSMDYGGSKPSVESSRKIIGPGDVMNDGTEVGRVLIGSTNKLGYYATLAVSSQGIKSVYMERDKNGLDLVAKGLDSLPNKSGKFGAAFGDLELDDTNSIILVSYYTPEGGGQSAEGVFYLCGGEVNDAGKLLASSGELLPESSTTVGRIGLVDVGKEDGEYVAQIYCGITEPEAKYKAMGRPHSALIGGNYSDTRRKTRLLMASKALRLSKAGEATSLRGDVLYGPRIGGSKKVAQVVHTSPDHLNLYFDGTLVASTGSISPSGWTIGSFSAPFVGTDGLLYYLIYSEDGDELCVYNGKISSTVLSIGDSLGDENGPFVAQTDFAMVRNVVDSEGRLVFVATLVDSTESITKSIVLGIPV